MISSNPRIPQPVATKESQTFWDAARQGRLVLLHCSSCCCFVPPISSRCPNCLTTNISPRECSGRAVLVGRTVLRVAAYEGQALPATLVECALEEDERIVLVGTDPDDLSRDMRPGTPLTLIFEPTATGDALVRIFKAGTT